MSFLGAGQYNSCIGYKYIIPKLGTWINKKNNFKRFYQLPIIYVYYVFLKIF